MDIIEYFIKEPEREYHIRELAKLTKKSPTTVSKNLAKFKSEGLLVLRRKFNHLLYKANAENPAFKDTKLTHNINSIRESGLIDYLVENYNQPEAIVLFGSFRKAEDIPSSDIDLLVVTPLKKEVSLEKFEKKLGRKIQLFAHSNSELEKMKLKNKELFNNWLNGIVLYGFWEVLK